MYFLQGQQFVPVSDTNLQFHINYENTYFAYRLAFVSPSEATSFCFSDEVDEATITAELDRDKQKLRS